MDEQQQKRLEELIKRHSAGYDLSAAGRSHLLWIIDELNELAELLLEASRDLLRNEGLEVDGQGS